MKLLQELTCNAELTQLRWQVAALHREHAPIAEAITLWLGHSQGTGVITSNTLSGSCQAQVQQPMFMHDVCCEGHLLSALLRLHCNFCKLVQVRPMSLQVFAVPAEIPPAQNASK